MYATPQHLSLEEQELRSYSDQSWSRHLQLAQDDVVVALRARGIDADCVTDASAKATATLLFELGDIGDPPVTLEAGTEVYADDTCGVHGRLVFALDEETVVTSAAPVEAEATAVAAGTPWNTDAHTLQLWVESVAGSSVTVTNQHPASGGVDHPLARVTTYRALELIMGDLMRSEEDYFGQKRRLYRQRYHDEIDRLQRAGLAVGDTATRRTFGTLRFRRS